MAVDMYLDIDGIEGEAKDAKYGGKIAVLSWSWGETQSGAGGFGTGGGTGKVSMQDFHFTMRHCKASPVLMQRCASGKHYDKAVLTCRKAGDQPVEYLKVTFTKLIISSFQTGGSTGGDEYPIDQISFNYETIEMDYTPQNDDGSPGTAVHGGWNTKTNEAK